MDTAVKWSTLQQLADTADGGVPGWLSAPERERLRHIRASHRRAQFLGGRWLLRTLLAEHLGGQPLDWPLDAGESAPPALLAAHARPAVHLALSHSADVVACAVAASPVGLDVEAPRRRRDVAGLAALCLDTTEQAMLHALAAPADEAFFYQLWTVKEAWLKSRAEALAPRRLAQIHVRLVAGRGALQALTWRTGAWTLALAAPALGQVHWHAPMPGADQGWAVRDDGDAPSRGASGA